jgi:nucleotide-binding universal stress UspA family protein
MKMKMKNKVLLPIDGSKFSEQIAPHLSRFLDPTENEIILLQVTEEQQSFHLQEGVSEHTVYVDQIEASISDQLQNKMRPLVKSLGDAGFTVKPMVRFGNPAPKIMQVINDEKIDLVAMTTHGRVGLSRVFLGSVTEELLRHVAVPFLVVHPVA